MPEIPGSKAEKPETTEFAASLYKQTVQMSSEADNLLLSPLSVYLSMVMLRAGAARESARQIEAALNFDKATVNSSAINKAMQSFMGQLKVDASNCRISDKIWQQKYFCFYACRLFAETLKRYYGAEIGEVNFAVDPKKARAQINKWVNESTSGKIPEFFGPHVLTQDTRFVLTNAVFFRGAWKYPFIQDYTAPTSFTVLAKNGVQVKKRVPTMYVKQDLRIDYGIKSGYQLVELPYKNPRFSMIIVLPHTVSGLRDLERNITARELKRMVATVQRRSAWPLEVFLPKFTLSFSLDLNDALKGLGIKDIFDPARADLSKINGFRGMFVSSVTHKTFIKVNEFGTEATGATGTVTDDFNLDSIRVNRPFLFFIYHKSTESVVFLGRVMDPTK
eukprot:gene11129-12300_t